MASMKREEPPRRPKLSPEAVEAIKAKQRELAEQARRSHQMIADQIALDAGKSKPTIPDTPRDDSGKFAKRS